VNLTLAEKLRSVEIGERCSTGGLQVIGLRWKRAGGPPYLTLEEALAARTLDIAGVSEGGAVPFLKVTNRGDVAVFMKAGE
jgi:hypothetical protein